MRRYINPSTYQRNGKTLVSTPGIDMGCHALEEVQRVGDRAWWIWRPGMCWAGIGQRSYVPVEYFRILWSREEIDFIGGAELVPVATVVSTTAPGREWRAAKEDHIQWVRGEEPTP